LDNEAALDNEAGLAADADLDSELVDGAGVFVWTAVVSMAEGRGATTVESDVSFRCQPTGGTI